MGNIKRFDLERIIRDFKISHFIETGTFRGDAVAFAIQFPFRTIWSVEIVPELAEESKKRFFKNEEVRIVCADSVTALQNYLPGISGPALYWLDAHFPGADAGLTSYESEDENLRLPLALELQAISESRDTSKDVFILDDLRIYEDGDFEFGKVPQDAEPAGIRNIDFVTDLFERSHKLVRSYRDEGYLLLFPRKKYFLKHISFARLLGKPVEEDPYMY